MVRTGVATLIIVVLGLVGALVTARWAPSG
jgi:hypothetical protein